MIKLCLTIDLKWIDCTLSQTKIDTYVIECKIFYICKCLSVCFKSIFNYGLSIERQTIIKTY